jgi:sec-independent protein translocase protein TatA
MSLGPTELIIILLIVLLLFGGAKLPKLARSLGDAQKEFKSATQDAQKASEAAPAPAAAPAPVAPAAAAPGDQKVTMTQAELDALLAEREAAARRESPPAV